MSRFLIRCLLLVIIGASAGCANITSPTGGKKDTIPPKLVSIDPPDSLLNTRVKRIEIHFDEYITVADAPKEVQISPLLSIQPAVIGKNKTVVVKIVDSLLEDSTTYRLSFGAAIKDVHEGNVFKKYTYTFSTGPYFDSLQLQGKVISAATGLPDTTGVIVVLYKITDPDSAIVRTKPRYITKVDASGAFSFKGLPCRGFRIYAIKDLNNNLRYDGADAGEMIAFNNTNVWPGDTSQAPVKLRIFAEIPDSVLHKKTDSTLSKKSDSTIHKKAETDDAKPRALSGKGKKKETQGYTVSIDSSNSEKRTFDITHNINIVFNRLPVINKDRISLSYINAGGDTVKVNAKMLTDSLHPMELHIATDWEMDKVYILRLAKGFAKDTAGTDFMPSRYVFRTWDDDDYGKIQMHLPSKYLGNQYLLRIMADNDSVYQQPVTDTIINLHTLRPAKYTFFIIIDKNGNGKWDTGDLFGKIQPEEVIPYNDQLNLKPGWENIIDFEPAPKPVQNPKDEIPKTK